MTDVVREAAASRPDLVVDTNPERSGLAMAAKRTIQFVFLACVAPRLLAFHLGRLIWGRDRAFLAASESIGRIPGMRGVYARQAFYSRTLARCGKDVYFGWQSVFAMTVAEVGESVYIGRRCNLGFAEIGDNVMLADGVQILSGGREHGRTAPSADTSSSGTHQDQPRTFRRTKIGAGAWIGTNAVIMADVGAGAIIGAGAVVNRPVPAGAVAVGVPARLIEPKPSRD